MSKDEIARLFATTFKQASNNISAQVFSNSIRFIALSLVILAVMWSINHMMGAEEKQQQGYLLRLGSRIEESKKNEGSMVAFGTFAVMGITYLAISIASGYVGYTMITKFKI